MAFRCLNDKNNIPSQCSLQSLETVFWDTKTLGELFEEQVERIPKHIAIDHHETLLSYKELNEITNQLARFIRARYHSLTKKELKTDTLIPISIGRSADYVIGILAIIKAGAAYVPINPDYPDSRIQHILKDIDGALIITERRLNDKYNLKPYEIETICIDSREYLSEEKDNLTTLRIRANDLAYVIYTSGSSGTPKGVLAQHLNVISQVISADYFSADESETMAFFSDVSFDSTTFEIWGALLNGATLYIPDNFYELFSNATLFKETVQKKNLSILLITRALFDLLFTMDETVFASVKTLLVGGEALTKNIMLHLLHSKYKPQHLINAYGPTENSTFCTTLSIESDFSEFNSVPIGRPYSNRVGFVVDKHLQLMPLGITGELFVGGPSLSRGYLNQPELTQEKFILNPFFERSGYFYPKIYKTNDLVRWLPNGQLEYMGRNDFQVKLRGYRIELCEIETRMLECLEIQHSVVVLHHDNDLPFLIGYYVSLKEIPEQILKAHLSKTLPDYMIPSVFVHLETLPVTTNGKLDRKALPKIGLNSHTASLEEDTLNPISQVIYKIWSKVLNKTDFSFNTSFFNLGGNSLAAMMVRHALEEEFSININVVELFQYTTLMQLSERISDLLKDLGKQVTVSEVISQDQLITSSYLNEPIAIVGMSCRLPGVNTPDAFWSLLVNAKSNLRDFSDVELRESQISEQSIQNSRYVKRGAVFDNVYDFDAGFFGYSVRDADLMDPQQRFFLECAWEALENSGNVPEKFQGDIGVFATEGRNHYFMERVFNTEKSEVNLFQAILGNEKDFLSTKVSYKLDLKGPSITLQTACSSSLVAVQMACESLKIKSCDMALAGGVSIFYNRGYPYQEDLIESPDGYCRAFDADATGTIVTSGVGIVVLKRLTDALTQKDTIYAVIKGGAINNDGAAKMAFTAPSVTGQCAVIKKALKNSNVPSETISYVEAHGTGTKIGDPIEWTALHHVYYQSIEQDTHCMIGSVKTNIGHTDSAAGVFGLMKVALALKYSTIPATLNFKTLNPDIASFNQHFRISSETSKWESNGKIRRAAVSSFGLGGTNAHVILEEFNEKSSLYGNANNNRSNKKYLIPFSAKNREALYLYANQLRCFINKVECSQLPNIAFTAQEGRADFKERGFFIVKNISDASQERIEVAYLQDEEVQKNLKVILALSDLNDVSLQAFDGFDDQYSVYRTAYLDCCNIIQNTFGIDLMTEIKTDHSLQQKKLKGFACQYALVKLLLSTDIKIHGLFLQGMGYYVATSLFKDHSLKQLLIDLVLGQEVTPELNLGVKLYSSQTIALESNVLLVNIGFDKIFDAHHILQTNLIPNSRDDLQVLFLQFMGLLWSYGLSISWKSINTFNHSNRKISMPTYCFTRSRHELSLEKEVPQFNPVVACVNKKNISTEMQLKSMWSAVLGVDFDTVREDSDFLSLGGDSLAYIDLFKLIKESLSNRLNLEDLIEYNEFGRMVEFINSKAAQYG